MNVKEIKEALSKARSPYVISKETGDLLDNTGETVADFIYHEEDAHLIANAPEWLASLIEHNEQILQANERLSKKVQIEASAAHKARRQIEILQKTQSQIIARVSEISPSLAASIVQSLKGESE